MEKLQLVNFISKVMEESGFKVYKDFKTSQKVIDIYGILPSVMGDFSVVVACKNYDKQWEVGIDILKEMEMIGRNLKASKVVIVTSSIFSSQSRNYASKKNIKLIDRDNLMILAKKFSKKANTSHDSHNYVNTDFNSHNSFENPDIQSSEMKKNYGDNSNDNYDNSDSYHDNYYSQIQIIILGMFIGIILHLFLGKVVWVLKNRGLIQIQLILQYQEMILN